MTVVYNISPRLSQKRLHHTFKHFMGIIVIIGGIEAIHSHSNNVVNTEKKKVNYKMILTIYNNYIMNYNIHVVYIKLC